MAKLRSREYCHDCKQDGDWLFEDRPGNQIVECPHCGHLHYRVISGAYVDFAIEFRGERITNINRVREILAQHPETRAELETLFATLEFATSLEEAMKLTVTEERWGQDPRQARSLTVSWTVSSSTWISWSNTSTSGSTGNYIMFGTNDSTSY